MVNGLEDETHAKSPNRKDACTSAPNLVGLSSKTSLGNAGVEFATDLAESLVDVGGHGIHSSHCRKSDQGSYQSVFSGLDLALP